MADILKILRTETAEMHAATERELPLMSSELDVATYLRVLGGFWRFHVAWEEAALRVSAKNLAAQARSIARVDLLALDFADLGAAPPAPWGESPRVPDLSEPASMLGSMYVMEGSTLGGQHISRHLSSHFGWTEQHGLHFFSGYGAETGRNWKAFCGRLLKAPEPWHPAMIRAAQETFSAFGDCLHESLAGETCA